jgi:hypothetical protein
MPRSPPTPHTPPPPPPTPADVLYDPALWGPLLASLRAVGGPHALSFVAFKRRAAAEEGFAVGGVGGLWVGGVI